MSMKASDYSCVPLCADCHMRGPVAYHRIGKRALERVQPYSSVRLRRGYAGSGSAKARERERQPGTHLRRHSYSKCQGVG